jgi:lipoprotein-anchoring transpeptidase ErfK/SrfK
VIPGSENIAHPLVAEALGVDPAQAFAIYTISEEDLRQVTGRQPQDWLARAALKRLGYEDLEDALAERFHTSRAFLRSLNPQTRINRSASQTQIWVPNIRPFPNRLWTTRPIKAPQQAASLVIDIEAKCIRALSAEGVVLALFPCSIALDPTKIPRGDLTITIISTEPNYTFNPKAWPEVQNIHKILSIAPGPRNPVGLVWIALSRPGYGIHGTPHPEQIGKTGSHGCFRLSNWNALRLAGLVRPNLPVHVR